MNKIIITFIIGLISFSVFPQSKEITLEDIWQNHSFYYKSYRGFKSMNNGEFYTKMKKTDNGQEIIKYNFKNGKKVTTLFKSSDFKIKRITGYSFSEDDKLMLLTTETKSIYRYSKRSIYYVFKMFLSIFVTLLRKKPRV